MSKKFLVFLGAIIFYILFIAYSDIHNFSVAIVEFRYELLGPILVVAIVEMLLKGFRQQTLLKKSKIIIPLKSSMLLYLSGLSMTITPAASGQLIKSYYLKKKYNYSVSKTIPIIIIERWHDLLAVVILIAISLIFVHSVILSVMTIIIFGVLAIVFAGCRSSKVFNLLKRFSKKIPFMGRNLAKFEESHDGLRSLTGAKITFLAWLISIVSWILDAIVVKLIFVGFGVKLSMFHTIVAIYSSLVVGVVTLIPGGLGVTEITAVGLLIKAGLVLSLASSITLFYRIMSVWFPTLVGFVTTKMFLSQKIELDS